MAMEISTFGDFDIKIDGNSVLKKSKRTNKNLELLKYFITYRNRKLVPETIIDNMWPGMDFIDPKNTLRTQIFRLRKNLNEMSSAVKKDCACNFDIAFENGFYVFKVDDCCIVVADRFEDGINKADLIRKKDSDKAIEIYRDIINLYKGEYLSENPYSEWVFTIRSRYHRLFVQSLLRLLELLKSNDDFVEIIDIYERTVTYEPFEESLHIYFLESLIELKEYKNALSHYNYITGRMYREMSIRPTPMLKSIYRRILSDGEENQETDLIHVEKKLANDDKLDGALFCDIDYFKTIYKLERRKTLRTGNIKFSGLISIVQQNGGNFSDVDKEAASNTLKSVLLKSLRKGDVFSWWNPCQMVVLLTDVIEANLQLISKRIKKRFGDEIHSEKITIKITFQSVASKESFI